MSAGIVPDSWLLDKYSHLRITQASEPASRGSCNHHGLLQAGHEANLSWQLAGQLVVVCLEVSAKHSAQRQSPPLKHCVNTTNVSKYGL